MMKANTRKSERLPFKATRNKLQKATFIFKGGFFYLHRFHTFTAN